MPNVISNFIKLSREYYKLPIAKQLLLLVVLSFSIAISFGIVFWFQESSYAPLFTNLTSSEESEVISALNTKNVTYKMQDRTGTVLVPTDQVASLRLSLAAERIPSKPQGGFDLLEKNSSFGTSRFMENVRYIHALEFELAKTVAEIKGVSSASVHLAIPQESSFIEDNKKPSASVMVRLMPGYSLSQEQVIAITEMIATSVIGMDAKEVSVVDQDGSLLSQKIDQPFSPSKQELKYQTLIEHNYEQSILSLLTPILGQDKVRVRVNVDLDFRHKEQAAETFLPSKQNVSSRDNAIEAYNAPLAQGVPSTMSVQNTTLNPMNSLRNRDITNYQVSKQMSYTRFGAYKINNVSVAVIVDDRVITNAQTGIVVREALLPSELDKITELVKGAIGYMPSRGDSVSVVNAPFTSVKTAQFVNKPMFWQEAWFWDLIRKGLAALAFLAAAILFFRPVLKNLSNKEADKITPAIGNGAVVDHEADPLFSEHAATQESSHKTVLEFDAVQNMNRDGWDKVRAAVSNDPKKVADILRKWLEKP